jgi:hypothetical protein
MLEVNIDHECIKIEGLSEKLNINVKFGACRSNSKGYFFDIVDFYNRKIDRWSIPLVAIPNAVHLVNSKISEADIPVSKKFYIKELSTTHVVQASPNGVLFVNRGNFYNGTSISIIDTRNKKAFVFPDDYDKNPMLYTATGGFSPDYDYWYFVRWTLEDSLAIATGKKDTALCEVGRINTETLEYEFVYEIETTDEIHQITCSPNGRYLIFTSFKSILNVPYPDVNWSEDHKGYQKSHDGGIKPQNVITIDLKTKKNWKTEVLVPVSAHMEFDPNDTMVFYVSSHNFSVNRSPEVILEGSGAITKMRITGNSTVIDSVYSDKEFYRLSQHVPFTYQNRTLIAVTNIPNKLDFIDGLTMNLWRQASFFKASPLDFSVTGNVVSPGYEKAFYSINPSVDGRYVVLESSENFHIYDLDSDSFMEFDVSRYLPYGSNGTGHTRLVGH